MNNENYEICKNIADELHQIAILSTYKCPKCGETFEYSDDNFNDAEGLYECLCCGEEIDEDDLEVVTMYDYFSDVFDIKYVVDHEKNYISSIIMVACGGPNIYVDTYKREVRLRWWTESERVDLSDEAVNAIDECMMEVYICC